MCDVMCMKVLKGVSETGDDMIDSCVCEASDELLEIASLAKIGDEMTFIRVFEEGDEFLNVWMIE